MAGVPLASMQASLAPQRTEEGSTGLSRIGEARPPGLHMQQSRGPQEGAWSGVRQGKFPEAQQLQTVGQQHTPQ